MINQEKTDRSYFALSEGEGSFFFTIPNAFIIR